MRPSKGNTIVFVVNFYTGSVRLGSTSYSGRRTRDTKSLCKASCTVIRLLGSALHRSPLSLPNVNIRLSKSIAELSALGKRSAKFIGGM